MKIDSPVSLSAIPWFIPSMDFGSIAIVLCLMLDLGLPAPLDATVSPFLWTFFSSGSYQSGAFVHLVFLFRWRAGSVFPRLSSTFPPRDWMFSRSGGFFARSNTCPGCLNCPGYPTALFARYSPGASLPRFFSKSLLRRQAETSFGDRCTPADVPLVSV